MAYPKFVVSNKKEESINSIQRVKMICFLCQDDDLVFAC